MALFIYRIFTVLIFHSIQNAIQSRPLDLEKSWELNLKHENGQISKQGRNGTFHLPYFYSVNFSQYPKRDPESATRLRKIMGIEHVDSSNVKEHPNIIEDLLGDSETLGSRIIRKLVSGQHISDVEKIELSTFIALMHARNPAFHDFVSKMEEKMTDSHIQGVFSSKERVKDLYDDMLKDGYKKEIDIEEVMKLVQEKRYKISIPKESNIETMLMVVPVIDQILYSKTWLILRAPSDTSFVTSDNPVFLSHPDIYQKGFFGVGFATPDVEVVFPLSKECLLVMRDTDKGRMIMSKKINRAQVRQYNLRTFFHSRNYVIARDLALLNKLKESFSKK